MDNCSEGGGGERRLDNREEDTTDADQERKNSSSPTTSSLAGKSLFCHTDQQQQQIHQGFIPFTEYVKQRLFGGRQYGNDYESGDDDDDDDDDDDSSVGQDKGRRRLEPGSNSSAKNEDENDREDEPIGLSSSPSPSTEQQQQEQQDQQIRGSDTASGVTPSRHTNILRSTTLHLLQTYRRCSTEFAYEPKPQRICLTKPSEPSIDNKWDNEEGNLIMYLNDMLLDRYVVKELLGQGTFGQVVRCEDLQQGTQVAIKVIKNKRAYLRQALTERHILREVRA